MEFHQAAVRCPGVPAPVQHLGAYPAVRLVVQGPGLPVRSAEMDSADQLAVPRLSGPRGRLPRGAELQEPSGAPQCRQELQDARELEFWC